jgi:sugar phosphate isomerase/epimerase
MQVEQKIYPGLGIVHYVSFPALLGGEGPVVETLEITVADEMFETIEISWIKDRGLKQRACEIIRESGKRVVLSGGPPYAYQHINLSAFDPDERNRSIALAKQLIDDALFFGASIHLITGGPDTEPILRDKAKNQLVNSILELSDYIEARANETLPMLSLEPMDREIHRKGLIGPISEAVEVVREVHDRGGKVYLTIDQSHLAQLGENTVGALIAANEYLYHVHLANCIISDPSSPLYGDAHPYFGVPGGVHDLPEVVAFLKALKALGFFDRTPPYVGLPIISVEVKPQDDGDPLQSIEKTKAFLLKAFSKADL